MIFLLVLALDSVSAQSYSLRYVPGYCDKVEAKIDINSPSLYTSAGDVDCGAGVFKRLAGGPVHNFKFQLQRLNNGVFTNEGAPVYKYATTSGGSTIYRDLQDGETYRVSVEVRGTNGTPVFPYGNPCGTQAIGSWHNSSLSQTLLSNPLEIVDYNQFTDADMSGVLVTTSTSSGGPGNTILNRVKYCQDEVSITDIQYDITNTFGPDHWMVNLQKIDGNQPWAGGFWHDYELTDGTIDIFAEAWFDKYGSNSVWPGIYEVRIVGKRDCQGPWADNIDYFEIIPSGSGGCRLSNAIRADIDFKLYPNPATNYFEFYAMGNESTAGVRYEIRDVSGKLAGSGSLADKAGRVDISNLNVGLYIVSFLTSGQRISKRFSVIR